MDDGHGTLDNGLLDKRTISIESIVAPTRFIASIVLGIIVGVPFSDSYRDAFYQLYHFRTTPQLRCDYLYHFRTAPQLRCAPFGDQIFASRIGVKKKLSFAQLLFYSFTFEN